MGWGSVCVCVWEETGEKGKDQLSIIVIVIVLFSK